MRDQLQQAEADTKRMVELLKRAEQRIINPYVKRDEGLEAEIRLAIDEAIMSDQPKPASVSEIAWHSCTHCKEFGKAVKILDSHSYAIGEAKSWDDAEAICKAHTSAVEEALKQVADEWRVQFELKSEMFIQAQTENQQFREQLESKDGYSIGYQTAKADYSAKLQQVEADMKMIRELLDRYNDEARPAVAVLSDIEAIAFNTAIK
jgi:hypothetical protein